MINKAVTIQLLHKWIYYRARQAKTACNYNVQAENVQLQQQSSYTIRFIRETKKDFVLLVVT